MSDLSGDEITAFGAQSLRRFRERTGLSVADFAALVRRETGGREPTTEQLVAWEGGWESPPFDLWFEIAAVGAAHSRNKRR